jgi:hypothetical protein
LFRLLIDDVIVMTVLLMLITMMLAVDRSADVEHGVVVIGRHPLVAVRLIAARHADLQLGTAARIYPFLSCMSNFFF